MQRFVLAIIVLASACTSEPPPPCDFDVALDAALADHPYRDCGRVSPRSTTLELQTARQCVLDAVRARHAYVLEVEETDFRAAVYGIATADGFSTRVLFWGGTEANTHWATSSCETVEPADHCDVRAGSIDLCISCTSSGRGLVAQCPPP